MHMRINSVCNHLAERRCREYGIVFFLMMNNAVVDVDIGYFSECQSNIVFGLNVYRTKI